MFQQSISNLHFGGFRIKYQFILSYIDNFTCTFRPDSNTYPDVDPEIGL
jgi:hypothetical protein